jgi:hypothetical protein
LAALAGADLAATLRGLVSLRAARAHAKKRTIGVQTVNGERAVYEQ